jgi:serine phosphatase RsbU (regulator of sigma subunit)
VIPQTLLSKIIRKSAGQLLAGYLASTGERVSIIDADGVVLMGDSPLSNQLNALRIPIILDDSVSGWVVAPAGSKWAVQLADLVTYLLAQEAERRALAGEVLDKYRELHLLYRLSERLIASPKPEIIGQMALSEVCSASQSTRGLVILTHPDEGVNEIIATCGCSCSLRPEAFRTDRLIGKVISGGTAELSNHQPAGEYLENAEEETISLMCAPLKAEEQVFGVFVIIATSTRPFSAGDLKLLNAIAMQTAPAIEIAHLHQVELEKAWIERDLQMAQKVQSGLLPSQMPVLPGWQLAALWQPAHVVSGDLYDFIHFPDGKLGLVVADVTDKGMPAALLMANARSTLRGVAASAGRSGWDSPSRLLAQVNDVLSEETPMDMFVTCLLVVLDPETGHVRYANAGHNPPYLCNAQGAQELRATGIPLGLFPDLEYEEKEIYLQSGNSLLMYSDGLVEAHDPQRVMFGFPRLHQLLASLPEPPRLDSQELLLFLMEKLTAFTGPGWDQEDDITMVAIRRS